MSRDNEPVPVITQAPVCQCGHTTILHAQAYGSHRTVCTGPRAAGSRECKCDACEDHKSDPDLKGLAPDYCACKRFRVALAPAVAS